MNNIVISKGCILKNLKYLKVSFIGDTGVGKTSIIKSFLGEDIEKVSSTLGVDNYIIDRDGFKVILWDFAGQRWFSDILVNFIKGSKIIVLVFDLSDPKTLSSIFSYWLPNIKEYASDDAYIILVGNKSDVQSIPEGIIQKFLEKIQAQLNIKDFMKTSALNRENITELFQTILDSVTKKALEEIQKQKGS